MGQNDFLKRYTQLFSAIEYLETGELQLHRPDKWDDTNDSLALTLHAQQKKATAVYALCLTGASETFHHWKVFSPESRGSGGGVCIEFDKDQLIKAADQAGLEYDKVEYLSIEDLAAGATQGVSAPFLKRLPYKDEMEFRLFGTCSDLPAAKTLTFAVPLGAVKRITLSPWMNEETARKCRAYIRQIDGCESMSVVHSTLLDNKDWKSAITEIASTGG